LQGNFMTRINGMKKGFSLIELSISIIIIGLLVAGISSGSKLIEQAEMRAVIAEMQNFKKDYLTFKSTYDAVPGDFRNASVVFTNCANSGVGNANCNGNGDGLITFNMGNAWDGDALGDELVKYFRHMNLAEISAAGGGVVLGGYSSGDGVANVSSWGFPAGKISGTAYVVASVDAGNTGGSTQSVGAIADDFTDELISNFNARDTIVYMLKSRSTNTPFAGVMEPLAAFNLDRKIDDGAYSGSNATGANTGDFRVITDITGGSGCLSGANYTLTTTTTTCVPQLLIAR